MLFKSASSSIVRRPLSCEHCVVRLQVEGHKFSACTIDDKPTGDLPRVGEDGLQ